MIDVKESAGRIFDVINEDGTFVFRATVNALLLTEEQAERIKQRMAELEERIWHNAIEIRGLETMVIIKNAHISELESLVRDMRDVIAVYEKEFAGNFTAGENFDRRMREMGLEANV